MNSEPWPKSIEHKIYNGPCGTALDIGVSTEECSQLLAAHFRRVIAVETDPRTPNPLSLPKNVILLKSRTTHIEVTSLDDLHYRFCPIDFVKIDVQGAEVEILKSTIVYNWFKTRFLIKYYNNIKAVTRELDYLGLTNQTITVNAQHSWIFAE